MSSKPHSAPDAPDFVVVRDILRHCHPKFPEARYQLEQAEAALTRIEEAMVDGFNHEQGLLEQLEAAQKALRDFAEHGVRHDLNPTRKVPTPDSFWLTYIDRIDKAVRDRAHRALNSNPASEPKPSLKAFAECDCEYHAAPPEPCGWCGATSNQEREPSE